MTILLTRPERASRRTATRLAAAGHRVLVDPLLALHFAPPERLIGGTVPDAVIITSSNGARAVAGHPDLPRLADLPLWTVGSRTAEAARELGFANLCGEAPDASALGARLGAEPPQIFLYLAAAQRSDDFTALSSRHRVEIRVVYSAEPATALSEETVEALRTDAIACVLHYSRRLAETYLALARAAGLEAEALVPEQLCLSEQVAAPLRAAGAARIRIARVPREDALLELLTG